MQDITSLEMLDRLKREEDALLVLFGGRECNVCHSIKPKLIELVEARYPKIKMVYVDCHEVTDICAQEGVFTLPTLQVFFTGQRFIEEVRSFSLQKVVQEIERPYQLLFES
ncbi:Thioredoxin-like protein YtpP [Hydrogenovibrio crunogenus]|uniref:Thioredoxin-like protein YtpP n=1 Tax=Hydrogenovibrio crunogenus TaxID=39765 RepID=A0A4P7NYS8_9GAMM|nr:thioredoxin family protein [Hydrogenovibrio crunogenus]QBZ82907.1 Thioredoxin-like protein YtpP [Hydrogenovibrio crunogenus]RUM90638.1 MAG: thioredoxin [Thiomicrospira sp.]